MHVVVGATSIYCAMQGWNPRLPMTEVFVYFTILRGLRSLPVRWTAIQALLAVLLEASNGWRGSQSDARNHAI